MRAGHLTLFDVLPSLSSLDSLRGLPTLRNTGMAVRMSSHLGSLLYPQPPHFLHEEEDARAPGLDGLCDLNAVILFKILRHKVVYIDAMWASSARHLLHAWRQGTTGTRAHSQRLPWDPEHSSL